MKENNKCSALK